MKFGVLKDIKADEYRVIATPAEVAMIARTGAEVWVQKDAGKGAGFSDEAYAAEGKVPKSSIRWKKFMPIVILWQK